MREIIFRGKRADTGGWVYGDLIHAGYLYCIRETIEAFTKAGFNECVVNPETVGQYTGVKDRDGDIDRIQASGVSRSQQYRMAGNSIVVSVLFHIFRKMFVDTGSDNNELELF